jgi:hypothetical protein
MQEEEVVEVEEYHPSIVSTQQHQDQVVVLMV